jgi:hypothetical protein
VLACSISYALFKAANLNAQAFFWYRYSWLILCAWVMTLDINILATKDHQPFLFLSSPLMTACLKVVP